MIRGLSSPNDLEGMVGAVMTETSKREGPMNSFLLIGTFICQPNGQGTACLHELVNHFDLHFYRN